MLADHLRVGAKRRAQPLERRQLRVGCDPGPEVLDQGLEPRDVEPLLAPEVLEDEAVRDTGGVRDLVDRDLVVVTVTEDLEGGLEQLLPPLAGSLACQGTLGDRPG